MQSKKRYRIYWMSEHTHGTLKGITHMIIPVPEPLTGGASKLLDTSKCAYFAGDKMTYNPDHAE